MIEVDAAGLQQAVDALEGAEGVLNVAMFGRRLHVAVEEPELALRNFPPLLARWGATVRRMQLVEPTLEDAVMTLIRRAGGAVAG